MNFNNAMFELLLKGTSTKGQCIQLPLYKGHSKILTFPFVLETIHLKPPKKTTSQYIYNLLKRTTYQQETKWLNFILLPNSSLFGGFTVKEIVESTSEIT